jgi:hypothetical protein
MREREAEMPDTDRAPLAGLHRESDERRHRIFRFDPTVSSGTLLQLAGILVAAAVAYGTYREDRAQTKADVESVKTTATRDREETRAAIERFSGDLKDLKTDVVGARQDLAVLKAQTAQAPARPAPR